MQKKSIINTLESERITKSSIIWKYINLQKKGLDIDERIKIYNEISNLKLSDLEIFQKKHIKDKSFNTILIGKKDKIDFRDLRKYGEIEEVSLKDCLDISLIFINHQIIVSDVFRWNTKIFSHFLNCLIH